MDVTKYILPDGRRISAGTPFGLLVHFDDGSSDTLQFPYNWLSLASESDLSRFGITTETEEQPEPAPPTPAELAAYADEKLEAVQFAGCVINGVPVATSTRGLALLNGAVTRAQADPNAVTNWVVDAGQSIALDSVTAVALGLAVAVWIQSTYDALAAVYAEISGGTITTRAQIDSFGWPSNSA